MLLHIHELTRPSTAACVQPTVNHVSRLVGHAQAFTQAPENLLRAYVVHYVDNHLR